MGALLAQCPNLRAVNLCGNDLGDYDASDGDTSEVEEDCVWPRMSRLRIGNFCFCELSEVDQSALRRRAPPDATLFLRADLRSTVAEVDGNMAAEIASRSEAFGLLPV